MKGQPLWMDVLMTIFLQSIFGKASKSGDSQTFSSVPSTHPQQTESASILLKPEMHQNERINQCDIATVPPVFAQGSEPRRPFNDQELKPG
jgi:hypothetical protein